MIVAVSQRVDINEKVNERRDALDQRWITLLSQLRLTPLLIPNHSKVAQELIESFDCKGFLFTGGGDLAVYGGQSPERDSTEAILLEHAIRHHLPVLGVCRGMQVIQNYFGVKLEKVNNHVACRHKVLFSDGIDNVNSYHAWGAFTTCSDLLVEAKSEDGVVEAVSHLQLPIKGIMWHPEREQPFRSSDLKFISDLFWQRSM